MCIFESDTVKSDCPKQENDELFKDLIQTVCSGDIKKKRALKMTSQLVIFRAFFSFFRPTDPKSEKFR